jgi:hypothetical protein
VLFGFFFVLFVLFGLAAMLALGAAAVLALLGFLFGTAVVVLFRLALQVLSGFVDAASFPVLTCMALHDEAPQ